MTFKQRGLAGLHIIIGISVMAGLMFFAAPKYQQYLAKARMTEAFSLAGASKGRLTEFYQVTNRFPNSAEEAMSMKVDTFSPPEFVREVVIEHADPEHEVIIKVFLKEGVVENAAAPEPYIFVAGNRARQAGAMVQWTCGGHGIDLELLPNNCQG